MPSIRPLSQSLINKIAAGEVIERPASVLKELMENALDAGATRIDVSVADGGLALVRVADNGAGIPADELPLAVAPHATSKLAEADDLARIGTLGFRGEALASIGEVSRLVLRSRTAAGQGGAEIEVVGGAAGPTAPCGCPVGTTAEVHNLFFNTPVRRRFLRTPQTEFGHASEAFTRIALAAPAVHFTLRHNDRQVLDLPAAEAWTERIAAVAGRELAEHLIAVESADGPVRIRGSAAHPSYSRSNNRMQYLFLNGRHIRDHALQHALAEAYRGLLTVGRYAIAFLRIEMPPDMVDVNVHPTKLEVRFQDASRLYSQLLSTLRSKFLTTDLTVRVESAPAEDASAGHDAGRAAQLRQELVDWAKGKMASWPAGSALTPGDLTPDPSPGGRGENVAPGALPWPPELGPSQAPGERRPLELTRLDPGRWAPGEGLCGRPTDQVPPEPGSPATARPLLALQVHNRYLVTESREGVTIIDQHALHERILYEHLRARIAAGGIETQSLLVPEPVDLSPAEAAAALEDRELLARLGLRIEPFGGDTVLVAAFPAMLANMNPAEVLHALLERLVAGRRKPEREDMLDDLLHTIACRAAIKAGDRLSPGEIEALLQERHLVHDAHHCPHGRPTALVFTREELDRQFRRT
ncbi:MAG: DNA mismatch repair endonuclease MutL [Thermoguttaceae bacterium]|jgi:DNA mismatch repair protein MutL